MVAPVSSWRNRHSAPVGEHLQEHVAARVVEVLGVHVIACVGDGRGPVGTASSL